VTSTSSELTVAVTGPTGTLGLSLLERLERSDEVERVVGVARRPFDPAGRNLTKLDFRQGDVRDPDVLGEAFAGADVVVHLAFAITGSAGRDTIRAINVDGTVNAHRAAVAVGASRFVYTSSVAAYGFHADNPVGMTEDWPVRPADRLFYAREKAELELRLAEAAAEHPELALYVLRPPIVVGPDAIGAKEVLPGPLGAVLRRAVGALARAPVPVAAAVPALPLQLVHADDVAQALELCVLGEGPPGAYNVAAEGVLTIREVVDAFGATALPLPLGPTQRTARLLARLPSPSFAPPAGEWVEALAHPVVVDSTKARRELGWRPAHTGREALESMVADRSQVDHGRPSAGRRP
jgi:nucleoside-diphosphate-sugar epimerase